MSSDHISANESDMLLLLKEQVMYSFHQHKCWSTFFPLHFQALTEGQIIRKVNIVLNVYWNHQFDVIDWPP